MVKKSKVADNKALQHGKYLQPIFFPKLYLTDFAPGVMSVLKNNKINVDSKPYSVVDIRRMTVAKRKEMDFVADKQRLKLCLKCVSNSKVSVIKTETVDDSAKGFVQKAISMRKSLSDGTVLAYDHEKEQLQVRQGNIADFNENQGG